MDTMSSSGSSPVCSRASASTAASSGPLPWIAKPRTSLSAKRDLVRQRFELRLCDDSLAVSLDVVLGAETQDHLKQRKRALRCQASVGGVIEAVAKEEQAVGLNEHHARVGSVIAADVQQANGPIARGAGALPAP
jgi:hypothetical protein